MSFSYLGVAGFFAISGYLVMQSLSRSKTLKEYFLKRLLRIYPALALVLVLTCLLGVFVYNGSFLGYIENKPLWTYIPYNLSLVKFQYCISGIFDDNPFKLVINGSLCTLPYEIILYILLSVLFFLKSDTIKILILSSAIVTVLLLKIFINPYLAAHGYPFYTWRGIDYSGGFIAGALLALFKAEKINQKGFMLLLIILIWSVAIYFHVYIWAQYLVLPLMVVIVGTSSTSILRGIKSKIGDLSYGLYIYAFPVQQTLVHFFKLSYLPLMFWGALVSLPFAFLSWHLVEKKAIALK